MIHTRQTADDVTLRIRHMNKKTLGAVIKEGRDALRLTQRGLAEIVGVKASHIAYIENGHRNPSLALLRRLADALGTQPQGAVDPVASGREVPDG